MRHVSCIVGSLILAPLACQNTKDAGEAAPPPSGAASSCRAHQAVVEGLERRATRDAASNRVGKLRSASQFLPAIDEARALLRACQGLAPAQPVAPAAAPETRAQGAPLDETVEDLARTEPARSPAPEGVEHAAFDVDAAGSPTGPIRVKFLDGRPEGRAEVMQIADEWTRCDGTGLRFMYYDAGGRPLSPGAPEATEFDVRVSFRGRGYWSYIGRDVPTSVTAADPTMRLAGLDTSPDPTVVLHEFGHAVGLLHEHRREELVACIDEQRAIEHYGRPPNAWDAATVRKNLLTPIPAGVALSPSYDYDSIMNYRISRSVLKDGQCQRIELPRRVTRPSVTDCRMIAYYYPTTTAIASPPVGQSVVPFTTRSTPIGTRRGREYHTWTIVPRDAANPRIASVTYDMEPYFRPEVRTPAQGLEVTRTSWGTFPVEISVAYTDRAEPTKYTYYPELGQNVIRKR